MNMSVVTPQRCRMYFKLTVKVLSRLVCLLIFQ